MVNDDVKITGDVKIDIIGADGTVTDTREIKNLVVTSGKTFIASRMVGVASTIMGFMELGTGTTAAAIRSGPIVMVYPYGPRRGSR